jgi:hypothetical protein
MAYGALDATVEVDATAMTVPAGWHDHAAVVAVFDLSQSNSHVGRRATAVRVTLVFCERVRAGW